ncbi:hypothetical protein GCM10023314_23580 [Algibacter agarivorans]|uniref:CarboxypepD_reg-like domain-containing protein n=1 Tax=Algibacter agarivorans TaxID=1109741 RepID=A0ABP9GP43_9FLAO
MKYIILTAIFFVSAFTFAQNNGSISGNLLDIELNNAPLMFAKVSIKETGAEVLSDEHGAFKFQNLKDGTYTLTCSFTGYENKETEAKVISGKSTPIKLALTASTLSLDDLMMAMASADKKTTSASVN